MDTAPIDSYENASDIFTFGADSFGMWLFLILAAVLFVAMLIRMVTLERNNFIEAHLDD
jgi:hypothetical protein